MESIASNIYIIDYFKKLFRKENIGTVIFLGLNLILYIALMGGFATATTIPLAIFAYLVSVTVALSPIGEFILRVQSGCKPLKKYKRMPEVEERLVPIFERVYAKAKQADLSISDKVKIFMSREKSPNAFATGRKTICVTKGLLNYTDDQIEAVLAHEFGHIAHKDTDTLLVILVSNMLLSILFFGYRLVVNLVIVLVGVGDRGFVSLGNFITQIFVDLLLVWAIRIWTKIGVLLCLHSSRQNEYAADRFACELGYQQKLYSALDAICGDNGGKGFFASIASSHPDTDSRLDKIHGFVANEPITNNTSMAMKLPTNFPGKEQLATLMQKVPMGMAGVLPSLPKTFKMKEEVFAQYSGDGYFYFGHIESIVNGQADFIFYDAVRAWIVLSSLVQIKELQVPREAQANWQMQGSFYPCQITSLLENQTAEVTYGDGQKEILALSAVRFLK